MEQACRIRLKQTPFVPPFPLAISVWRSQADVTWRLAGPFAARASGVELAVFSSRAKGIPGKHRLPSRSGTNGKIPNSPLRFLMLAQTSIQTVASDDTTAAAWQPDRPESLVQMAPAPDSLIAGRRLTGGLSRARLSAL